MGWISSYKNESEYLLINQYLPIIKTKNYATNINQEVDYLLYSLKRRKDKIIDKQRFYNNLGIQYKKEWIIKYGIMGVLAIALMYTTVPLAHMLVLDLEVEPFAYESNTESDESYLSHHRMNTHITNELIGAPGMWNDSISVYHGEVILNGTPAWNMAHERLPFADSAILRTVVSDEYYSFTNQGYIWYVDAETGEIQNSYDCHKYVEDVETNISHLDFLSTLKSESI